MPERLKKTVMGIAALVALALGGAALAQAGGSGDKEKGSQAEQRSESRERENSPGDTDNVESEDDENGETGDEGEGEEGEGQEKGEKGEADDSVTGPDASKAKAAALEITKGGKANSVERDEEKGAVWEVEVTKPNGKTVDVRLDRNYKLVAVDGDGTEEEGSR